MDLLSESLTLIAGMFLGWLAAYLIMRRRQMADKTAIRALEDSLLSSEKRRRLLLDRIRERDSSLTSLRLLTSHHERIIDDLKDRFEGQMDMIRSLRAAAYYRSGDLNQLTAQGDLAGKPDAPDALGSTEQEMGETGGPPDNHLLSNGTGEDSSLPESNNPIKREEERRDVG